MSDRCWFLLALPLALVARPLAAQDDLSLLRRRVANLEAHRVLLDRAVVVQDSLVMVAESLQVIGAPPFQVLLPAAAAQGGAQIVDSVVAEFRARFGTLADRPSTELIRVRFESGSLADELDHPRTTRDFLGQLGYAVERALTTRIVGQLPDSFLPWIGGLLPQRNTEGDRVRAITVLLSDSTGEGIRCLRGEIPTCRGLLTRETRTARTLRLSLVGSIIADGGVESWGRMAGPGPVENALERGGQMPLDSVIGRWTEELRTPQVASGGPLMWLLASGLGWAFVLAVFFLWRIQWHHA